jgi:predicted enzyme related to lactoylglutathione lyase
MPNVVFFEICVDDLDAAASFYSRVFGWNIEQGGPDDGWLITTGDEDDPGIPGALASRYDELSSTVCTFEVPSVAESARKVTEAGGRVVAPQIAIPGEGFVQYCEDHEGNAFAIVEYVGEVEYDEEVEYSQETE